MEKMLRKAILSIKSGDIAVGQQILSRILRDDDKNEMAWLWMTKCVTEPDQKRECFERVLLINPNNKHAIDGIDRLDAFSDKNISQHIDPISQPPVKPKNKTKVILYTILIFFLSIIFLIFCGLCARLNNSIESTDDNKPTSTSKPPTVTHSQASIMCEQIVEPMLKAPSTAKFAPSYKQSVIKLVEESNKYKTAYRVRGYVDAQNSFGAQIRTYYTCDMSFSGGEWNDWSNWKILRFDMDD